MATKQDPSAVNGNWQLFLLGYSNEKVRKAFIINALTHAKYNAHVSEQKEKDKTIYTILDAVDAEKNLFVNLFKTFTVQNTVVRFK